MWEKEQRKRSSGSGGITVVRRATAWSRSNTDSPCRRSGQGVLTAVLHGSGSVGIAAASEIEPTLLGLINGRGAASNAWKPPALIAPHPPPPQIQSQHRTLPGVKRACSSRSTLAKWIWRSVMEPDLERKGRVQGRRWAGAAARTEAVLHSCSMQHPLRNAATPEATHRPSSSESVSMANPKISSPVGAGRQQALVQLLRQRLPGLVVLGKLVQRLAVICGGRAGEAGMDRWARRHRVERYRHETEASIACRSYTHGPCTPAGSVQPPNIATHSTSSP